mmetsp:Transcript_92513/g.239531  ORF Transcript_92513/g.239531 Transcript_92513/m.239531 type:complete len:252 (+) Transcript_92513:3-758(+)
MREDVPELRVRVLVDTAVGSHAEVAPARDRALELDAVDLAAGGLEAVVRVLRRNAGRDDVPVRVDVVVFQEVDGAAVVHIPAVEPADLRNPVQGDAHAHLQLCRWQVHPRKLLGHRVLHLEAGVELEEVKLFAFCVEKVLYGTRTDVADVLREALSGALHLQEGVPGHDRRRALLENLLKAALRGAIAAVERNSIAMLVANNLHLDVPGALAQLHDEDRRARRRLVLHLWEVGHDLLLGVAHADAFATTAL